MDSAADAGLKDHDRYEVLPVAIAPVGTSQALKTWRSSPTCSPRCPGTPSAC